MNLRFITLIILTFLLILPVIAVNPTETYIQAAETLRNRPGGEEASAAMFEKANDVSQGRYDLLREEARMYAEAHQYQKAMDTMNRSIKLGGEHPSSYLFMAVWAMEGFNNTTMRDEYLNRTILSEVNDAVDSYNKAMAQAFLGDIKGGAKTIVNATEQYNTTDYLWDWRGLFEAVGGNYSDAIRSYDQAINLSTDPQTKAYFLTKKAKYLTMGGLATPEEILNIRERAISLDKGTGQDFEAFIGTAYFQKGDLKNASVKFALDKSPNYQVYSIDSLLRADYLYKTGKLKEAVKIYEQCRAIAEEKIKNNVWESLSSYVYLNMAESGLLHYAMDRKDKESAVTYATSLAQKNPEMAIYQKNLADAKNLTAESKS